MIVFDLKCPDEHVFEAWFRDSKTFERQRKSGAIACPSCGSTQIDKALMAPNVATRKGRDETPRAEAGTETTMMPDPREAMARAYAQAVREHIRKNFDDVGDKFADEARKIHYGETDKRNIHGRATKDQAKALAEEGVEFGTVPFPINLDG
ncbi:MAG: DUF1178 family protein [Alphaproteobacteria bacterium]|nr:DUF1178 family protein [Alphaproteobacteria bacterium]